MAKETATKKTTIESRIRTIASGNKGHNMPVWFKLITCALAYLKVPFWYVKAAIITLIVTVFEASSIKGTDNLTVPILTSLLVWMVL